MEKEKLYNFNYLDCVHNNLNLCKENEKEIVLNLLESSIPKQIETFKSDETDLDIEGTSFGVHTIQIEDAEIEINSITQNITELANFILRVAYYSNQQLLFPVDDECLYTAIITTPIDNKNIRITVTNEFGWYIKNAKIMTDFIIKRTNFIEQFNNIFKKYINCIGESWWGYKETLANTQLLDLYLDNPAEFHNNFKLENYVRVFDIAYKDLENKWNFVLYNSYELKPEDEEKTNISYWQKLKDNNKILDYDFREQDATSLAFVDEIKTDLHTRIQEENWAYSKYFKKFYSTNEPMDCHINCGIVLGRNLQFKIDVSLEHNNDTKESIIKEYYLSNCYDWLKCELIIIDNYFHDTYKIKFDYKNIENIKKCIKNLKRKKYARTYLDCEKTRLHLWYGKNNDVYLSIIEEDVDNYLENSQDYETMNLIIDSKTFISSVTESFKNFELELKKYKNVYKIGKKLELEKTTKIDNLQEFKGNYACAEINYSWGILDKELDWVIKPETITIYEQTSSDGSQETKRVVKKYCSLHNVNGKLFIAETHDKKKFVMDINEDIKISHISNNIYYQYLNDKLYFLIQDSNKSYLTTEDGKDILEFDFEIGSKFYLLDKIIILQKQDMFGIVDWNKNLIVDYVLSDVKISTSAPNLISYKYFDKWGVIDIKGNSNNTQQAVLISAYNL